MKIRWAALLVDWLFIAAFVLLFGWKAGVLAGVFGLWSFWDGIRRRGRK